MSSKDYWFVWSEIESLKWNDMKAGYCSSIAMKSLIIKNDCISEKLIWQEFSLEELSSFSSALLSDINEDKAFGEVNESLLRMSERWRLVVLN